MRERDHDGWMADKFGEEMIAIEPMKLCKQCDDRIKEIEGVDDSVFLEVTNGMVRSVVVNKGNYWGYRKRK